MMVEDQQVTALPFRAFRAFRAPTRGYYRDISAPRNGLIADRTVDCRDNDPPFEPGGIATPRRSIITVCDVVKPITTEVTAQGSDESKAQARCDREGRCDPYDEPTGVITTTTSPYGDFLLPRWPSVLNSLDTGTITPYFARTLRWTASKSLPEVANSALPSTGDEPSRTRPRTSDGCTTTLGLFRSRLCLPDVDDVQKPTRPPSSGTIHVGVDTPEPVLRKVVTATYFASLSAMLQV